MKRTLYPILAIPFLAGCPSSPPAPEKTALTTAPPAVLAPLPSAIVLAVSASAAASASAAPPVGPPPTCRVAAQKSWASGANVTTGLTAAELPDGRVAIGLAIGNTPHVLVVGRGGGGRLIKAPANEGSDLAKAIKPADGRRFLMRVTPVKVSGDAATAFADYRDEYKNKRRHVACGPADGDASWIKFDGVPLLDRDPQPTGDEYDALFKSKDTDGDEGYHELRDCRSFADLKKNETWIVGSEVRALKAADGTVSWKASLVIDHGPTTHETHLHELDLKGTPPKVTDFQVPVLHALHDGAWVLTARYGGEMLAAILNADKSLRGKIVRYPGFSTLADVSSDGNDTIVATSFAKGKDFVLRAMRLDGTDPTLPKTLEPIVTDYDDVDSEQEPDFTRDTKGQRWVSYVDGERGKGHLEIVPVDTHFNAMGRPYSITEENDHSSEGRLIPLTDGTILVVFLKTTGNSVELVTEELTCEVRK